jgi:hypothetical protein
LVAKRVAVMFIVLRVSFRLSVVVDDQPKVSPARCGPVCPGS